MFIEGNKSKKSTQKNKKRSFLKMNEIFKSFLLVFIFEVMNFYVSKQLQFRYML